MTISIKHALTALQGDGTDATQVRPSDWNADHIVKLAPNTLIGRTAAGVGLAQEIALSTFMGGLLGSADLPTLLAALGGGIASTGDIKLTTKVIADVGWVFLNDQEIGPPGSVARNRANNDTQALFTLLFNNFTDTYVPVFSTAGTPVTRASLSNSASTAWTANCCIALPRLAGRAVAIGGAGLGLTNRLFGQYLGEENHTLSQDELPAAALAVNASGGGTISGTSNHNDIIFGNPGGTMNSGGATQGTLTGGGFANGNIIISGTASVTVAGVTSNMGNSNPHNNMQPTGFTNGMIKL
jgi:microcystin-dependent protein